MCTEGALHGLSLVATDRRGWHGHTATPLLTLMVQVTASPTPWPLAAAQRAPYPHAPLNFLTSWQGRQPTRALKFTDSVPQPFHIPVIIGIVGSELYVSVLQLRHRLPCSSLPERNLRPAQHG